MSFVYYKYEIQIIKIMFLWNWGIFDSIENLS